LVVKRKHGAVFQKSRSKVKKKKFTQKFIEYQISIRSLFHIVRACNDFEYFGLIGDKATDVSTHEQVSVYVRFVECTSGKVILR
jgi:hypothetical protein